MKHSFKPYLTALYLACSLAYADENDQEHSQSHTQYTRVNNAQNTPDSTQVLGARQPRVQRWVAPAQNTGATGFYDEGVCTHNCTDNQGDTDTGYGGGDGGGDGGGW